MNSSRITTVRGVPFLDFSVRTPYTWRRFKLSVRRDHRAGAAEGGMDWKVVGAPGHVGPRLLPALLPSTQLADLRDVPGGSVTPEDTVCQAGRSLDF